MKHITFTGHTATVDDETTDNPMREYEAMLWSVLGWIVVLAIGAVGVPCLIAYGATNWGWFR